VGRYGNVSDVRKRAASGREVYYGTRSITLGQWFHGSFASVAEIMLAAKGVPVVMAMRRCGCKVYIMVVGDAQREIISSCNF